MPKGLERCLLDPFTIFTGFLFFSVPHLFRYHSKPFGTQCTSYSLMVRKLMEKKHHGLRKKKNGEKSLFIAWTAEWRVLSKRTTSDGRFCEKKHAHFSVELLSYVLQL